MLSFIEFLPFYFLFIPLTPIMDIDVITVEITPRKIHSQEGQPTSFNNNTFFGIGPLWDGIELNLSKKKE